MSYMTISFSNSSPEIPNLSILSLKFRNFYFCTKLSNKTNLRMQISNMTIIFSNSSPKIYRLSVFGPKFSQFCCFFHEILQLDKFKALISNMTILFSNFSQKYQNKTFLVPNLSIFVFFHENFFTIFVVASKFAARPIPGWRFQIWQQHFL